MDLGKIGFARCEIYSWTTGPLPRKGENAGAVRCAAQGLRHDFPPRRKGDRLQAFGVVAVTTDWTAGEFPGRDGAIEKNSPDTRACMFISRAEGTFSFAPN